MEKQAVSNSFSSVAKLTEMLGVTKPELYTAIEIGYRRYSIFKNGKIRYIEQPNDKLKLISQKLLIYLRENLECPPYCMAGYSKQNNIQNAKRHAKKREILVSDIIHFFLNTKAKYVRQFFEKYFNAQGEVLDLLVKLTTYKGYLPTGAPTSTFISCFAHKEIFDLIYTKMKEQGIDMTTYFDDITISTNKHIGNWVIGFINKALNAHGLHLKKSKTKRYGYKSAVVTGVYIAQDGKLSTPYEMNYSVVKKLCEKDISQMTLKELKKLIGKIAYIRKLHPKKFKATQTKAIKQLKKLKRQMLVNNQYDRKEKYD